MRIGRFVIPAFVALLATAGTAAAQTGRITGTVVDSTSGQPLTAVQVQVSGTTLGAQTGADGRYTIVNVPAGTHTVEARRIGYAPARRANVVVTADAAATADLTMRVAALQLQQVVTTGIVDPTSGTRVPFTVGRLEAADAPVPATNAIENLQGKIAGATMVPSAQPGSGTSIVLRTPTSINKTTDPLVVVDGVILSQSFDGSFADLQSLDVESIEVVKGAAAASLYGSRAANGVIQIRTRRGGNLADGATRFTVRSEMGMNSLANPIEWAQYHTYQLNGDGEYLNAGGAVESCAPTMSETECRALRRATRVEEDTLRFQDNAYPDPVYDQVDAFFDPGQFFRNSINIAQNTGRTNWFFSFVNAREDGVVLGNGAYEQNDMRLNLDHRLGENLTLSFSGYHMRSKRDELNDDTFFDLINQAPDVDLSQPDPDGTPYIFQPDPVGREENPLYVLSTEQEQRKRARTQGSLEARYAPLSWLSFDANVSYDRSDRRTNFFLDQGAKTEGFGNGGPGAISEFTGTTDALNAAASVNLLGRFGGFTLRSTARGLMERENNQLTTAEGENLTVPGVPSLDNAQSRFVESSREEIRSNGFFVTAGADYEGRYIVDGLMRRDGSSLFGPEERWNTYYRVSGAYRMAEESWWPFPVFNEFKLRASRGTAGGRPDFEDQFETYGFSEGGGLVKRTLGNRFLKPELATETELGLDMIVADRYSLQLSYAKNRVEDQLVEIPLAGFFGYASQWQNAGTVEGNTIEASFEAQLIRRPTLSWKLGLVADRSRNEITNFGAPCFIDPDLEIAFRCAGETLGAMYGFRMIKSTGELPADAQAQASEFHVNDEGLLVWVGPGNSYTQGASAGLWGTQATIGSNSYDWGMPITLLDETGSAAVVKIGDGNPDFHFGVSNSVNWRDFTFYTLVDAQVGGQVYNRTNQRMYQYGRSADVDQVGKAEEFKKPVEYYVSLYAANSVVDYFVEDAGFVKLREVAVGYQVPTRFLNRLGNVGVEGVKLNLVGRNLLTFSDYKGYDPEVGNSVVNRLDSFSYPRYRTITGSVEITF